MSPGDSSQLLETALSGIMASVDDPYTVYLSPREIRQLDEMLAGGDFGGIGVYIFPMRNGDVVVQPIEGMPAARAGMKSCDVVDTVDGTPVHGLTPDRVQDLIRGAFGDDRHDRSAPVSKPKLEHTYRIVREIIHVPTVRAKMESGIDYIRLSDFGETSARRDARRSTRRQGPRREGYILDLRDNGGGLVDAAVDIVELLRSGRQTIVAEVDRDGHATRRWPTAR